MVCVMRVVPFSRRTGWDRTENELSRRVDTLRKAGALRWDLTESNPTRVGLPAEGAQSLVALLGHGRGATYEPAALGHEEARQAVSDYYRDAGFPMDPSRVILTASTSEAYGWLFKLLCEVGDEVLVPTPGYPLFGFLADLEGVTLCPFPLRGPERRVDFEALEEVLSPRTRAIVLVHPNNPTGTFVAADDRRRLVALAASRGLALVVDEVFLDYALEDGERRPPSFVDEDGALTFVLSGLSKVVALPQLKLGWMVLGGPPPLVDEARGRLEILADCYLSVGTPVQRAAAELLGARHRLQRQLRERVRGNLAHLDGALTPSLCLQRAPVEAGWYATLELPPLGDDETGPDEEALVLSLLEAGILVHPGYFFDFDDDRRRLVVSLLPPPEVFAPAATQLVRELQCVTGHGG